MKAAILLLTLSTVNSYAQSPSMTRLEDFVSAYAETKCDPKQKHTDLELRQISSAIFDVLMSESLIRERLKKIDTVCARLTDSQSKKSCFIEQVNGVLGYFQSQEIDKFVNMVVDPSFLSSYLMGLDSLENEPQIPQFEGLINSSKDLPQLMGTFKTRATLLLSNTLKISKQYMKETYCAD